MQPTFARPQGVKNFSLDDKKISLPQKEIFFDLLNNAHANLGPQIEQLPSYLRQEAKEKFDTIIGEIRMMINELSNGDTRTFYEQEKFCKDANRKIAEFREWLRAHGGHIFAQRIRNCQKGVQRTVRQLTSLATN